MAGQTEWPQSLKDFANRTFAACTDANRQAVSEELKGLIFKSFQDGTINTTDWNKVELVSLTNIKKKKAPLKKRLATTDASAGPSDLNWEEQSRREKRARRFEGDALSQRMEEEQEAAKSAAFASSSLAGRLGNRMPFGQQGQGAGGAGGYVLDPGYMQTAPPAALGKAGAVPMPFGTGKKKQKGMASYGTPAAFGGGFSALSGRPAGRLIDPDVADPNVIDWDEHTVVGVSTKLEKPYLRLTSAPDPKTVRPLPILEQALELLKKKWRSEQNYAYICDQFKSMRQDLTVQRIKNPFTVKVYEIHARIALEKGDLGEYNQCQSQLRMLYAYNLPGCVMEFLAYRILYLLHTLNRREVNSLMTELEDKHKQDPAVRHALRVRSALVTGNYHRLFKLYDDAPNMNAYIMDHFVQRERVKALHVIAKCYRPHCPLAFLTAELSFADDQECEKFLKSFSADTFVQPTPAEAATQLVSANTTKNSKKIPSSSANSSSAEPVAERKWDTRAALPAVIAAMNKHKKVDIKGQI